jgi:hypothetical protein
MSGLISHLGYDYQTGCWNWTGARFKISRYGAVRYKRRTISVHRLAAHLWPGFDLSSPLSICHHCDNRACFNPKHLFVGTRQDNMRDASRKGRLHKTHCHRGHPLVEGNLYTKNGNKIWRACRTCVLENAKNRQLH